IVLSWILPKTSAAELIRAVRERPGGAATKILITVSGYSGTNPVSDAKRVGADDLLPKPFSDADLLARLGALLEIDSAAMRRIETELGDFSIEPPPQKHPAGAHAAAQGGEKLTASDIFGEVLGEEAAPAPGASHPAPASVPAPEAPPAAEGGPPRALDDEIDLLLSQTLVSLKKKKEAARAESPIAKIDKLVEDTLSGIHRSRKHDASATPQPVNEPEPVPSAPAEQMSEEKELLAPPPPEPDDVHAASPIVEPIEEETATARPGAKFGQFVLREKIATGGMAEIWKAQMHGVEGFEKLVAIKRILPHLSADQEFVAMFVDEAKIAARLNHPHITHIYDLGLAAGSHYIAMELVDGHDLKSALRRAAACERPMSIELAVFVASRLAAALDYAHRKEEGLVHRDVSPQNVLVSWDGDIKLCDFGIAKATSRVSHTQTGALKGKLQYMSPEQASGKPIDRRSDIFSLGSVLFEMLAHRKLFAGENEASVLDQVREAHVEPPSKWNDDVPKELDRIVLRALAKEPGDRYPSAADMARDLDQILYTFRPAPAAADLAVWMHQIWSTEPVPVHLPEPEPEPAPAPEPEPVAAGSPKASPVPGPLPIPIPTPTPRTDAALAASPMRPEEIAPAAGSPRAAQESAPPPVLSPLSAPEAPRSKRGLIAAAVITIVAIGAVAGWFVVRSRGASGAPSVPAASTSAGMISQTPQVARPAMTQTAPTTTDSIELQAAQPDTAAAAPSPALVDQEVQRRLDLERQRLEALRRRQQEAEARPAPILGRAVPPATSPAEPSPERATATASPPPPPVETAVTATAPATAEAAAVAPPVAEPEPQPVRRGDYVAPGTPGLVDPALVALGKVMYPPMARTRKVQGIVILQVLVSETGSVVEARVLRGVKPDVGIDEAALQAARGASFKPATKDGVPVRTLKTITIPFKL
ncbi:MAG TPA: TonB family protein, partial [Thermoanaerobaculia bacterium]